MRFFIFIFFIHFLYADDTILSRIKACSNGKNLTCKLRYEPEFITQDNNLVFQKRYQACFSSLDSLKNISQSSFWLYNPIPQRKHIYPKLDLVSFGMSLNEADLFLLEIENDKKPRLNIRCAYISYKNKQGLLVEHSLGQKIIDTYKKYVFFIDEISFAKDEEYKDIKNYTLSIIFEAPQGFFKADWFFGDWR